MNSHSNPTIATTTPATNTISTAPSANIGSSRGGGSSDAILDTILSAGSSKERSGVQSPTTDPDSLLQVKKNPVTSLSTLSGILTSDDSTFIEDVVSPSNISPATPREEDDLAERQVELQRKRQQLIELRQLAERKKQQNEAGAPSRSFSITETHRVPSLNMLHNLASTSSPSPSPPSAAAVSAAAYSAAVTASAAVVNTAGTGAGVTTTTSTSGMSGHSALSHSASLARAASPTHSQSVTKNSNPSQHSPGTLTTFTVEIHKLAPDITLTEYTGPFIPSPELKKRVSVLPQDLKKKSSLRPWLIFFLETNWIRRLFHCI